MLWQVLDIEGTSIYTGQGRLRRDVSTYRTTRVDIGTQPTKNFATFANLSFVRECPNPEVITGSPNGLVV